MQRRQFIRNSVAGGLGLALAPSRSLFAATVATPLTVLQNQPGPCLLKTQPDDLKLNAADTSLLSLLTGFADKVYFNGGCVAGKYAKGSFRATHVLARIANLPNFNNFVTKRAALTGQGMSIGNTICFNYKQTTFELEALLPDAFQQRLADIKNGINADGTKMTYAHEAVLYEPATKILTDPYKAFAGTVAALKRINIPAGYAQLAKGNLDTIAFRLTASSRDRADLSTLRSRPVNSSDEALQVTKAFFQQLSFNSQVSTTADLTLQCGTRIVRSALQAILGCDSIRVAGNFPLLRARFAADFTDGSVWHALFQGAERPLDFQPKAGAFAGSSGSELTMYLTMQELTKVGMIKASTYFAPYA